MSEENIVRRKCDFCALRQEYNAQVTEQEAEAASKWTILTRLFPINGQVYPVHKHACKESCAVNIIKMGMVDLPPEIKAQQEAQRQQQENLKKKFHDAMNRADHVFVPALDSEFPESVCAVEGCKHAAEQHPKTIGNA